MQLHLTEFVLESTYLFLQMVPSHIEHRHRPFRVNCENAIRGTSLDMKGLQYHFRHFLICFKKLPNIIFYSPKEQ